MILSVVDICVAYPWNLLQGSESIIIQTQKFIASAKTAITENS